MYFFLSWRCLFCRDGDKGESGGVGAPGIPGGKGDPTFHLHEVLHHWAAVVAQ